MTARYPVLVGATLLAALSTGADYIWWRNIPPHQLSSGLIHAGVLFVVLGGYLGWRKGQFLAGAIGGDLAATVAAGSFYALAPIGGYSMMIVSWVLLWVMLAGLQTYLDGKLDVGRAIGRGAIAALAAGLGFAVVLFSLYRRWPPEEFPAARHFIAWAMAYLPGLSVLLQPRRIGRGG